MINFQNHFIKHYYNPNWLDNSKFIYTNAKPFPHIIIDNFLPLDFLHTIINNFPTPKEIDWTRFDNANEIKLGTKNELFIPHSIRSILQELNSGYILDWLELLTGVPGLIADTRLIGGGLHQITSGGKLGIHRDFNIENKTKMARKLNLLLYLNKDWNEEWGGDLELWDKNKENCITKISPIANRCVIFNTTGFAWHGHPLPLNCPSNITRKSLALYYYNVDNSIIDAHSTIF